MNRNVVAILLLLAVLIGYLVFSSRQLPTKDEALRFVQEDLTSKYPGAEYEILSAEKDGGNWNIKAKATFDAGRPCPSRLHAEYKYPQFGYVVREEWITRNCQVCIGLAPDKCVVFFEEEAVIASHNRPGAEEVSAYILAHPDAVPSARFYGEQGYPPDNPVYYDVWLVSWHSETDGSFLNVLLSKSQGSIIRVWGKE